MQEILERIEKSEEYKDIQRYFDKSGCDNPELIGYVMDLCRKSNAKDCNNWIYFYIQTSNMMHFQESAMKLYTYLCENHKEKHYTHKNCMDCLMCFIFLKTWKGLQKEQEARLLFDDELWNVRLTTKEEDNKYAVDLVINYKNKDLWGIQVKPDTFKNMKEEISVNLEKNKIYKQKFGYSVMYVFYDENGDFDLEDIEKKKKKMKDLILSSQRG